jgi:SAM-dependent methyltransferase
MVTLRAFSNQMEAALAKSVLDDHNIASALADEGAYLYGGAPLAMPVRLLVAEEHLEEANRILDSGGQDRADVELAAACETAAPPLANQNPWELLAVALLLALPGFVLLFQTKGIVLVAPYRRITRGAITLIPAANVQLIGAFVVAAALFLVGVYFYLRRNAAALERETTSNGNPLDDPPAIMGAEVEGPNSYSAPWFDFFHFGIPEERTDKETEFVCAVAPLPAFRRVLDVCCGTGRHARSLAARGYAVTGLERDAAAIAKARQLEAGPDYIQKDVRDYRPARNAYDLAIVMSQSFGYFDEETNRDLLGRLAHGLRKGGRMVLDLWNPDFFAAHQGERELQTARGIVRENKKVQAGRLFVHLTYPDGAEDNFEWQLFTPTQVKEVAVSVGLVLLEAWTDYDTAIQANSASPKIQFVLERQ